MKSGLSLDQDLAHSSTVCMVGVANFIPILQRRIPIAAERGTKSSYSVFCASTLGFSHFAKLTLHARPSQDVKPGQ